jgi:serine/threonine-protein kinase
MVPRIGTEYAGYRILALLGRGGMSVVYRAENPRLGMTVALKVLAPELADDEVFRERFVSESRLAAALNHPNIITIYDAGEADGALFIAMRFVRGDLRAVLVEEGPLEPGRAVGLLEQVASALDAAHAEGLIHRDVKPANILLDSADGRPEVAYLADFGLTKHVGSHTGLTASGAFLGTIDYMAPEQIEDQPLDGRADVYSLGCVAFQCLTGAPPFPRATEAAVLWAHMQEPPPRVSDLRPGLPSGLDAAVARALAKAPEERFQTCGELAAALAASLEGRRTLERTRELTPPAATPGPPVAPEPDRPPRARPRRRLGRWLALAAALLAGAAAGAAAAFFAVERDPTERVVTQTQTVSPPADDLTAFDRELLRSIPASFRDSCVSIEPIAPGFDASVRCSPGQGVLRADFSHARSGDILQEYFRGRVVAAGIEVSEGDPLPKVGTCGSAEPSVREWTASGRAGHEETDSFLLELQGYNSVERQRLIGGQVLCHPQRGRYWVEWTDHPTGIYTLATGASSIALVRWWQESAGPLAPR